MANPTLLAHAEMDTGSGSATADLTTLTIASGADILIVVQGFVPTVSASSVVLDPAGLNLSLTALSASVTSSATSSGRGLRVWYLLNPPAGTYTIRGTLSGVVLQTLSGSTWDSVDTGSPFGTPVSTTGTTGTSASVNTGSVAFFLSFLGLRSTSTPSPGGSQTQVSGHQSSTNQQWYVSSQTSGSTASWSWTGSDQNVLQGVQLKGLTAVSASRGTTWNVAAQVSSSRATTWNVRSAVTPATRATTWVVRAAVSSTRATTWVVRAAVASTRATTWTTRASVTPATRATTWTTRATITSTRATTWSTAAQVSGSRATSWAVLAAITATRSTTWNVAGGLTPVSASRATTWHVRAQVASTRATTWTTRAALSATRSTTWTVRTPVAGSRATTWKVDAQVVASRATTWHVAARVTGSRATTWAVLAAVAAQRSTTWLVHLAHVPGDTVVVIDPGTSPLVVRQNLSDAVLVLADPRIVTVTDDPAAGVVVRASAPGAAIVRRPG